MRATKPVVLSASVAGAIAGCLLLVLTGASGPDSRLPGSQVVIEAGSYESLQAAIDALPGEGGIVRLPPGEFTIDEPLVVRTGETSIIGCGPATHIKNVNQQGMSALILEKPADQKAALWRIHLQDYRLTGNSKSANGIDTRAINEIDIEGVTVTHHGGDGIRLDHCYEDPRVCDCLITYNKAVGLNLLGCHDIVVAGNQFEENNDALHCIDGFNLCMTGNCLDDHLRHGVVIENTYGSVVSGNMIEECNGTALIMDRDCYGNTVSANVIAHDGKGEDLRDAHGCAISANTFTIMLGDALIIGPQSGRITVTGNNFSNSYIGDGKVKRGQEQLMAGGVRLSGAQDVTFVGNLLAGLNPEAFTTEDPPSQRVAVVANVLRNVESQHDALVESQVTDNLHRGDGTVEGT